MFCDVRGTDEILAIIEKLIRRQKYQNVPLHMDEDLA